jgi:hypothetical protein
MRCPECDDKMENRAVFGWNIQQGVSVWFECSCGYFTDKVRPQNKRPERQKRED